MAQDYSPETTSQILDSRLRTATLRLNRNYKSSFCSKISGLSGNLLLQPRSKLLSVANRSRSLEYRKGNNNVVTIRDVAKESGFSPSTVSIVLNNAPLSRYIPPQTKSRIEKA